jgi:alkanesulfonate monooxygenase SsuD/methylene tetrahydromethanopterin reductase-like flavin-dependent oxidoreductase (luciferase family)
MDVGIAAIFQNPTATRTDHEVYKRELAMAELAANQLGFDSIWGVEHHFTDYTMCPDVTQFLAYCAGRCPTAQIGSMVIVLPWHDPMRVAEEIAMLDNMSDGRFILGLGRGLGRIEFEGFGKDQNDSREFFVEAAEMIIKGLESGTCEYNGKHVKQLRRDIRPRPFKTFKGRTYAAAVSPESFEIMARLGAGVLVIPQKPWETTVKELAGYREFFQKQNGIPAPAPIIASWVICDEDAGRAEELARKYIGGYWRTVVQHYEMVGDHFSKLKGYETYREIQTRSSRPGGLDEMVEFFMGIQVWGTPAMCYDKIVNVLDKTHGGAFTGVFSYAGMPWEAAEGNLRLFAKQVLPELKRLNKRPLLELAA